MVLVEGWWWRRVSLVVLETLLHAGAAKTNLVNIEPFHFFEFVVLLLLNKELLLQQLLSLLLLQLMMTRLT